MPRFVLLSSVYRSFAERWQRQLGPTGSTTYEDLHAEFIATRYGWSDFLSSALRRRGIEAADIFAVEALQRAWADERDLVFSDIDEVLVSQVHHLEPDVVFLPDVFRFGKPFRERLRGAMPAGSILVGWRGEPTTDFTELGDLDIVVSSLPSFVASLQDVGIRSFLLPFAFDPRVLDEVGDVRRTLDFSFAGTVSAPAGMHSARYEVIRSLLRETPLEVWTPATSETFGRNLARRLAFAGNRFLEILGVDETSRASLPGLGVASGWARPPMSARRLTRRWGDRFHPPVFGLEYFELLGRSKLTLNVHIDVAGAEAANVRLFEATGMGACLVTDAKRDLDSYFRPEEEVVTYRDPEEAVDIVHGLLSDPPRARGIAAAGQQRTLGDHTYDHMARRLLDGLGIDAGAGG